jgi:hypothetical protein
VTERGHGLAHDEVDPLGHVATALDVAIGYQAGLGQRLTVLVQRGRSRSTGADADAVTMKGALIVIGRNHLDAGSVASPPGDRVDGGRVGCGRHVDAGYDLAVSAVRDHWAADPDARAPRVAGVTRRRARSRTRLPPVTPASPMHFARNHRAATGPRDISIPHMLMPRRSGAGRGVPGVFHSATRQAGRHR